jgi:hypothetical protein
VATTARQRETLQIGGANGSKGRSDTIGDACWLSVVTRVEISLSETTEE